MMTMTSFKLQLIELLNKQLPESSLDLGSLLSSPPDSSKGHFALPCFAWAKTLKTNPKVLAETWAAEFGSTQIFEKAEAINGYLNFFIRRDVIVKSVLNEITEQKFEYGNSPSNSKTAVIDYSSPNVGKQLAFHHLRSTMIGNCLSRSYKAAGWNVERINHLGDWGTQFGKLIVMYLREGGKTDDVSLSELTLPYLGELYVKFGKVLVENPQLDDEAREAFSKMEVGDELCLKIWNAFKTVTITELKKLYTLLDVEFDHWNGEAFFNSHMPQVIDLLNSKELITRSKELDVVFLEDKGIKEPCLIRKSDGASLYATRDLAAGIYRQNEYKFDKCLYIVDKGQSLHFKQVFGVLDKCGFEWSKTMEHIPFGLILQWDEFAEKWSKGSSKQGNTNTLREVFDAASERILKVISEKNPNLENKEKIAEEIGVSALVFNDLKNKRSGDVKFDWDQALSFEGDTGPYVQNAHVRLCSIMRKAGYTVDFLEVNWSHLEDPQAYELVLVLAKISERVHQVVKTNEPCVMTQYTLDIAEATHRFIHHCRVMGVEQEKSRLFLVQSAQIVMKNALEMIGVRAIETM
jgi:arginyl-tRNA synthetase